MTAMLEGVEPVSRENTNGEDAIQSQILECSTRPTECPQAEVHFSHVTQQRVQGLKYR
jgi:hypothetical protein